MREFLQSPLNLISADVIVPTETFSLRPAALLNGITMALSLTNNENSVMKGLEISHNYPLKNENATRVACQFNVAE